MAGENFQPWEDNGFLILILYTLWIYLPRFLVNTFAMMWGKWFPKTGYGPWPIDGGRIGRTETGFWVTVRLGMAS